VFFANGYDKNASIPRIEIWNRIKKRTGIEIEHLKNRPYLPQGSEYLWKFYLELKQGCDSVGINEIDSYSRLFQKVTPWEASILIEIDLIRRRIK
jgi:hypothetical protein